MVTIILETVAAATIISPLAGYVSYKLNRFLERRRRNKVAKRVLTQFDNLDQNLAGAHAVAVKDSEECDSREAVTLATARLLGVGVGNVSIDSGSAAGEAERMKVARGGWVRVRPDRFNTLAMAAADEAYNEYGARRRSEANDLVTRKFLRDQFRQLEDLRAKDMNRLIEVALPLSYVQPPQREVMTNMWDCPAFEQRTHYDGRLFK
jgi:gluconate kinase